MLPLILFLVLVYVVTGIIGFVGEGLLWLFVVAAVLLLATLVVGGVTRGRQSGAAPPPAPDPDRVPALEAFSSPPRDPEHARVGSVGN
jgi:hypothetical protein